jgi:hypothetical protein
MGNLRHYVLKQERTNSNSRIGFVATIAYFRCCQFIDIINNRAEFRGDIKMETNLLICACLMDGKGSAKKLT